MKKSLNPILQQFQTNEDSSRIPWRAAAASVYLRHVVEIPVTAIPAQYRKHFESIVSVLGACVLADTQFQTMAKVLGTTAVIEKNGGENG